MTIDEQTKTITDKMDECFNTLFQSPSEKTVKVAHQLEELVKEYRGQCADTLLKNIANVSQAIVTDLKKFGIIFYTPEEANEFEKKGVEIHK